jgi:non-homologous end joining protein Ku
MHADFEPAEHTDTYTERLTELVHAKASGGELAPVEREAEAEVADLLAALEASLAKTTA